MRPVIGAKYRHYKGNIYIVNEIAMSIVWSMRCGKKRGKFE
jgi:hypothetical protein